MRQKPLKRLLIMFRVEVASLGMDQAAGIPIVILNKKDGEEAFPFPLSHLEAASVAAALKGEEPSFPAIHHVFTSFIRQMGYRVLRAEIKDLHGRDKTARILLTADAEDRLTINVRPCDAIAMAVCFKAPLYLGVEAEKTPARTKIMDESAEGEKWAAFLESLDADRFGNA